MSKNEKDIENSIIDHYVTYENMEIGRAYILQLKTGGIISGALVTKYEFWDCNCAEIIRAYTFAINKSKIIDFTENEIETIDLISHYNEQRHKSVLEYLEKSQERHDIKCFNDEGRLSNSTLLGEVVVGKKLWDRLSEEEKKEFVEKLKLRTDDIVEVINVCAKTLKENGRLHDEKLKVLDEAVNLIERFKKVEKRFPDFKSVEKMYDFFYKDLMISDLINLTV